jgi:NodT family efflux transporter outer membrane factor (OMF) lipoprotein
MKRAIFSTLAGLLLAGCTLGPNFKAPVPPAVANYTAKGDLALPDDQRLMVGAKIEGDWWTGFHSPALSDVIKLALANNQDVAAARARVTQVEEDVKAAEGALFPQVSLGGTVQRQKYGAALFGPLNFSIPPFTAYTIGPAVTFPLDIFGGTRRSVEEKAAYLEYQHYELDAAYRTLTAHIAAEALALAASRAQIETLNAIIADDQRNVELVQSAISAGSATRVQLLTAQTQLADDRTLMPDLRQQESTARHAMALLAGKTPAEWSPPDFALTDFILPAGVPASMPSELVHRRPDIMAAEAQLHVASAAIGVATANLYPKINLTGTITQQALTPGGLFNSAATAWSIAANITQPIFDGGRLSAERRAAVANYQATLATYRQTILVAFGEVADRLQAVANGADRVQAQATAAETAGQSLDLARRSYQAGNSGILDVIDAERRYAQAQLALTRAKAQRLLDTAQLYLALGETPVSAESTAQQ